VERYIIEMKELRVLDVRFNEIRQDEKDRIRGKKE
jgi:hypothetical protein